MNTQICYSLVVEARMASDTILLRPTCSTVSRQLNCTNHPLAISTATDREVYVYVPIIRAPIIRRLLSNGVLFDIPIQCIL